MGTHLTTPFGRRPLSRAMVAAQALAKEFAAQPHAADAVVHKWKLFRALTEAKGPLGVNDRALAVLYALLSFHQETALALSDEDAGLVVFPSNKELLLRAHGMAPATLRRHLAALVEAGLIIRRDSPNGKRFARRGQGGKIDNAFGFDLSPLVARAAEIDNLAEEVRAEKRAVALLREKITLARRDIVKMIEAGLEEGVQGDWAAFQTLHQTLAARYGRNLARAELASLAGDLAALAHELQKLLETHVKSQNMSANESQTERHIQNQETESFFDLEPSLREGGAAAPEISAHEMRDGAEVKPQTLAETPPDVRPKPTSARAYPLGMVLDVCPDIIDFAKGRSVSNWRDLATAAALARAALGVSPDAWEKALIAMGEQTAAIVIAAILQKGVEIKSAGGYLRSLTTKATAGEFSLGPMLMALLRSKMAKPREQKRAG